VSDKAVTAIYPKLVRYIKLGDAGRWERECIDNGIIRFGFGTNEDAKFDVCVQRDWNELTNMFIAEGRNQGTATRFTNETRIFFEDNSSTLWITFNGDDLWWGFLSNDAPAAHADGLGVWRRVQNGWKNTDINGEPLTKNRLSGALTKLAAYRGTSCSVDVEEYLIRRINGQKVEQVERALAARTEMIDAAIGLMRLLGPKDFELLVDLVFTSSGWRRTSVVGKTQKFLDLDLVLPSTGERACVQVKSKTDSKELAAYLEQLGDFTSHTRMFFVFHTGNIDQPGDDRVSIVGPDKLAVRVVEAGLVGWLIEKTS
jgi:hypothetical protein